MGGLTTMGGAALLLSSMKSNGFQDPRTVVTAALPAVVQGNVKLPVTRVGLFSSGVGFFERTGTIDNDATVELSFPSGDINDLLKSLVVRDQGGGQVETVSLDSNAPLEKTLSSFAIDLQGEPGFGQILGQARGEKVEVIYSPGPGLTNVRSTGTIIGLETRKEAVGSSLPPIDKDFLILNTESGLRNFPVSQFVSVRFTDPGLEAELQKALDALARARDVRKKTIALRFTGRGQRVAKVSYVTEAPIWKTTYRLAMDGEEKPVLLGWGIVENPTDDDWNNVKLSLVSGRPMSFRMDLWQSLYVDRPMVVPELFKSLRPVTYDGDLSKPKPSQVKPAMGALGAGGGLGGLGGGLGALGGGLGGNLGGGGMAPGAGSPSPSDNFFGQGNPDPGHEEGLTNPLNQGVQSIALAKELGQAFEYQIKTPISLARRKSAMIPILNSKVDLEKLSIYNATVHPKYPLLGIRLTNGTGAHLVQGPVTIFDGGTYAGDGRLVDMEPGEKRFLSYAVDLGVEIQPTKSGSSPRDVQIVGEKEALPDFKNQQIVVLSISKGLITLRQAERITTLYKVVNRSNKPRKIILEEPILRTGVGSGENWKLVESPKPEEQTADFYRFAVQIEPEKSSELKTVQENQVRETFALSNASPQQIQDLLAKATLSAQAKQALEKLQGLKADWKKQESNRSEVEKKIASIFLDQQRLRANLKEVPPTSAAYKRFLTKFDEQEPQLEALQKEVETLRTKEGLLRQAYEEYLTNLEIK